METDNRLLQEDLDNAVNSTDFGFLRNKTVLVTGATGLIGSRFVLMLLAANRIKNENIKVVAVVRDLEKARSVFGESFNNDALTMSVTDLTEEEIKADDVDYVLHCASITNSKFMVERPVDTINASLIGTHNVLEFCKKNKPVMVYVSSMEMYGRFDEPVVVKEDMIGYLNPLSVRSNYPEAKRMCENMCVAFASQYELDIKIARLAQVFGAGILPGENRVFAQFAKSVINKTDIVLHTEGNSEGNYCYLSDALRGIVYIMRDGKTAEAYNVSNELSHTSIKDMARLVAGDIAGGQIKVVFDIPNDNRFGYAQETHMTLDNSKLKALGWSPKYNLKESYVRLIESLKN